MTTNPAQLLEPEAYAGLCRAIVQRARPSDWEALSHPEWLARVVVAENEGVASLLYWCFKQQGWPSGTPDEIRMRLTSAFYATSARNTLLLAELNRIAPTLQDDGISVLAVKGAALVCQLYPNIGLRPMSDIDLLVPRSEVDKAARILEDRGYERTVVQSERLNRLIGTQLGFAAKSVPDLRIEVHWSLVAGTLDRRAPDIGWFWSQAESFQITDGPESRPLLTLMPTAHLLYVAAHAVLEHGISGVRLLWLHDVHLILDRWASQIAWDDLFSRAAAFGWAPALTIALRATAARFGTLLPEEVEARLVQGASSAGSAIAGTADARRNLKLAEHGQRVTGLNMQARLWYALAMVFPSSRYMRAHYGRTKRLWWPLLYVVRWAEMVRSAAQS